MSQDKPPHDDRNSDDEVPPEKRKKEVISVYAAIVGFILIMISFVWNLISALDSPK